MLLLFLSPRLNHIRAAGKHHQLSLPRTSRDRVLHQRLCAQTSPAITGGGADTNVNLWASACGRRFCMTDVRCDTTWTSRFLTSGTWCSSLLDFDLHIGTYVARVFMNCCACVVKVEINKTNGALNQYSVYPILKTVKYCANFGFQRKNSKISKCWAWLNVF